MKKLLRCAIFAVLGVGVAPLASAGELNITMKDGRVTVIAKEVPLRQILAEWARIGRTTVVNAEKLTGPPLTLELVDVPEKEALDILLRSAAGYITAARATAEPGAALYDRVIILATSRPPAATATAPAPFGVQRQPIPQPLPQPPPDDDPGDPGDQGPVQAPMQGVPQPGTQAFPGQMIAPQGQPLGPNAQPMPMQPFPGQQAPTTAPRPGQLPVQPQPQQINPYTPIGPDGRPIQVPVRPGGPGGPGGE